MKTLLLLVLVSALRFHTFAADAIPPELVGEWTSTDAEFNGEFLKKGGALYIGTNGFAAVVSAPPPLGMFGTATYDAKRFTLTLDVHDKGKPPMVRKMKIIYDPKAKTLTTETKPADGVKKGTFTRRGKEIPKWILDASK